MMFCYVLYVIFMRFNSTVEMWVKGKLKRNQVMTARSRDNLMNVETGARQQVRSTQKKA